jgi:hypothetical protein
VGDLTIFQVILGLVFYFLLVCFMLKQYSLLFAIY